MSIKIGINGFGRIAKIAILAMEEMGEPYEVVGINWRSRDLDYMVYMLKYDSVFGRFNGTLDKYEDGIVINGKKIPVFAETDATRIPWAACGAEYIIDATGAYTSTEKGMEHIQAGAKHMIISAPAKDKVTPTFVYGVNHEKYTSDMKVVSAASCTTNCLAPLCKVLQDNFGIDHGLMSTIHAATAKQKVVDAKSLKDWRTGRTTFGNVIPTTTGAAKAVGLVIPEIQGKMNGIAYRVPTADVSVVDLNIGFETATTYDEVCQKVKEAAETYLSEVIEYVDDEVVSSDFIKCSRPCAFDAREGIELNQTFFKFVCYYDNEWGYTCNMLRLIRHMAETDHK
ncbi:MAG: type I glyceraldehyde-3-phosphate dehydrogenase [Firmicutes bacterium]|nr:type I glyceraldehyde-3-phosphate dehydrogenase [Bacillota bacterium]